MEVHQKLLLLEKINNHQRVASDCNPFFMQNNIKYILVIFAALLVSSCNNSTEERTESIPCDSEFVESNQESFIVEKTTGVSLVVLGTTQDAGSPQINCQKECCVALKKNPDLERMVVSLGLVDQENQKKYLFEASPDISRQLHLLYDYSGFGNESPDGIFLTHAHIGHYSGLMYLGKEAMDAHGIPVYAMPKMKTFLETNGPWNMLVENKNILIQNLEKDETNQVSSNIKVTPFLVPHRDEYSETVGYKINGPNKSALFIPDIDKWDKWNKNILDEIKSVDYVFIDATFYTNEELKNRDLSQIPHPFVSESMDLFSSLSKDEKDRVYFIHLNHTNPLLNQDSEASLEVENRGFHVARLGNVFEM